MEQDNGREILSCENLQKSFFLRKKEFSLLGGLEPATSGEILWQGKRLGKAENEHWAALRRDKLGIIFQNYNLITSWTAFENVEAPLLFRGTSENNRRNMLQDLMKRLDILTLADNKPSEMSEGQQQRVAVARTLVTAPLLILADEPTGEVDPETGEIIISELLSMVKNNNACLLVTTHGGNSLPAIADRIFLLVKGNIRPL